MLLLLSLINFTSFDGVSTLKILQRYSSSVIFIKCSKAGKAFFLCDELMLVEFVETNVDVSVDSI